MERNNKDNIQLKEMISEKKKTPPSPLDALPPFHIPNYRLQNPHFDETSTRIVSRVSVESNPLLTKDENGP